jgi:hypothetical protein
MIGSFHGTQSVTFSKIPFKSLSNPKLTKKLLNGNSYGINSADKKLDDLILDSIMEKKIMDEMLELSAQIAKEHYELTDNVDRNLNYLWYMYHKGSKVGTFRPFVYMAELQLLKRMGYINDTEIKNMIAMLESSDEENLHMVTLSIKSFRDLRVKEHGEYSKVNKAYTKIAKDYPHEILNHEVFMKTMSPANG